MLAAQPRRRRQRAQCHSRLIEAVEAFKAACYTGAYTSLSFNICVTLARGYRFWPRCLNTVAREKLAQPITTSTQPRPWDLLLPHHIPASSLLELHPESELGKVPVFQRKSHSFPMKLNQLWSQTKTDPKLFPVNRDSVSLLYLWYGMFSYSRICIPYQAARVEDWVAGRTEVFSLSKRGYISERENEKHTSKAYARCPRSLNAKIAGAKSNLHNIFQQFINIFQQFIKKDRRVYWHIASLGCHLNADTLHENFDKIQTSRPLGHRVS